jgi:molecular chaperone GrpE
VSYTALIPLTNITGTMLIKGSVMGEPDIDNVNENEKAVTDDIEELRKALAAEKTKSEENLARCQRAQADFINYKRFAEQEKAENCKYANANLLLNLLPVIDDFRRALAVIQSEAAESKWVEGLKLIDRKFQDALEKQGVTCFKSLGEEFDPRCMEALASIKGKKDIVVQELHPGYKLNEKVISPAKVIVGSGEE